MRTSLALAALLFAASVVPSFAAELRPAWAAAAPAIDGNASAAAWNGGTPLSFKAADGDSTSVRLLEDAKNVYVAIHAVQRDRIVAVAVHDGVAVQQDDGITLQFRGPQARLAFRVNPFGAHEATSSASTDFAPDWNSAGRILKGAYEITIRIPRESLDGSGAFWKLAVSRHIAVLQKNFSSAAMTLEPALTNTAFQNAHIVAGDRGKFVDAYRSLWPSGAADPSLPQSSGGVAVKSSVGPVTLVALDAHTATRDDNAQAIAFRTDEDRLSATLSRTQSTGADVHDTVDSLSLDYDDSAGTTGGLYWSAIGDDNGGGSSSLSGNARREFGSFSLEGSAQSTRDALGNLLSASEQAAFSSTLGRNVSVGVDTQSNYDSVIGPYSENGITVNCGATENNANISYRAGHYEAGFLQDARIAAALSVPTLGSLRLEHRQGNFYSPGLATTMQQSTSVGLRRASRNGSIGISYEYVSGELPLFLGTASQAGGGISVSLDRYLAGGLLHANFDEQRSAFAAAPSFTIKFLPGIQ